jgi:regulator of protease activity HflC (stomatin/prohibitin superfamily)
MDYLYQQMNRPARRGGFRRTFVVNESQCGLLYRHGRYVRTVNAGRHVMWGFGWTMNAMDLRKTSVLVAGQEVLTADNVGLKLSLLVTYQVIDPVNPALMNLRLMQSLSAAQNAGNTLVLGMPGGFVPLKNGKPNPPPDPPAEN